MARRRRSKRYGLWFAIGGLAVAIACYVLGLAWWQSRGRTLYEFEDLLIPRLIDVVIVLWLMWVGSSVGSFLNVVAWRMPRGESVNGRSHCPRCESRLKARDNFPVFGWLALGGRCRTCRLPISPRYPIVEFIVGLSIAAVGIAELFRLALPYQINHWHGGPLWTPIIDRPMLLILLYHVVLLSCTWAQGLISFDGHRLPPRLVLFSLAAAVIPLFAFPPLMIVSWQLVTPPGWPLDETVITGQWLTVIIRVLAAIAAAAFFARLLAIRWLPSADPKGDPLGKQTGRLVDLIVLIAVPAVVLGWQSTPMVIVTALCLCVPCGWLFKQADPLQRFAITLPIAMTLQLITWRIAQQTPLWTSVDSTPQTFLLTTALIWIFSSLQNGSKPNTELQDTELQDTELHDTEPQDTRPTAPGRANTSASNLAASSPEEPDASTETLRP